MAADVSGLKRIDMGLLQKVLNRFPFYKQYQSRLNEKHLAAEEARLKPLRKQFYSQFINTGDLVFDVGANVGNRIEAFLDCGANVVAVEPQPSCANILSGKFGDRIKLENVGLSDAEGELEMFLSNDTTVSTFNTEFINATRERFRYSHWNDKIKVKVTTLDHLLQKHGTPRFCKIDVEGFELQVLKGLHTPIPYVSLEYCVPEMLQLTIDCVNYLHRLSPGGVFNYSIGETMHWAQRDWLGHEDFVRHIRQPKFSETLFGDIYFKTA